MLSFVFLPSHSGAAAPQRLHGRPPHEATPPLLAIFGRASTALGTTSAPWFHFGLAPAVNVDPLVASVGRARATTGHPLIISSECPLCVFASLHMLDLGPCSLNGSLDYVSRLSPIERLVSNWFGQLVKALSGWQRAPY